MTPRRALLSVSNKTGLVELARGLVGHGVALIASGGTARALREAGLEVTAVSDWTGAPEILGGRVKTLHPRIHGGILARPEHAADASDCAARDIPPIEIVVVNLYPFAAAAARGASDAELIEEIDIGGPTLLRAAAKNHARVTVLCDPEDYAGVLADLGRDGEVGLRRRRELARKAFGHTASYDAMIVDELERRSDEDDGTGGDEDDTPAALPATFALTGPRVRSLRYGENPQQRAALYALPGGLSGLAGAEQLGGKDLSYNNLCDADAARDFVTEWSAPAACIIKHASPCGAATGASLPEILEAAWRGDPLSAFGGIVAVNRKVSLDAAQVLTAKGRFIEVVIAPDYDEDALAKLRKKKALRILRVANDAGLRRCDARLISGGLLVQDRDAGGDDPADFEVVTKARPSDQDLADAAFAVHCVKHVKSNAIVLVRDGELLGAGGGRPSRVGAVEIAVAKAGERSEGSLLASDAFFPFPDGVEAAAAAGVRTVVQPGGSKRDGEVIARADELGLAMILTGRRHFRH